MKSSTYRTEMSIAGGNCGMNSLLSTICHRRTTCNVHCFRDEREGSFVGCDGCPLWPARHTLRPDCKLGVRGLDAQLPGRNNSEHNQDPPGGFCGLHRHTSKL